MFVFLFDFYIWDVSFNLWMFFTAQEKHPNQGDMY